MMAPVLVSRGLLPVVAALAELGVVHLTCFN
jgi:hypothetical protein